MLRLTLNARGFEELEADGHLAVQMSSAYRDDSLGKPGSSCLWVGDAHLTREDVADLVRRLEGWLKTGSLK